MNPGSSDRVERADKRRNPNARQYDRVEKPRKHGCFLHAKATIIWVRDCISRSLVDFIQRSSLTLAVNIRVARRIWEREAAGGAAGLDRRPAVSRCALLKDSWAHSHSIINRFRKPAWLKGVAMIRVSFTVGVYRQKSSLNAGAGYRAICAA
jgi:hypothetical protein